MSNQAAIDWFARNVHKWPSHDDVAHCCPPSGLGLPEYISLHKDQWLARRAELQNKPSWADAPEWAEWLAQSPTDDRTGIWCFFSAEPTDEVNGIWSCSTGKALTARSGLILGHWRDTLECRPVDLSEPAVTSRLTEATDNVLAAAPELMTDKYKFDPLTSIKDNQEQKMQQDNGWFERGELPPAGVECEFRHPIFGWTGCDIVGHYRLHAVCAPDGGEFYGGGVGDFRPIRTERDELMDVIASQGFLSRDGGVCGQIADAIIAAGFKRDGGVA